MLGIGVLAAAGGLLAPIAARGDVIGAAVAFTLHGSHGYRITVIAASRRANGRGEILVFAQRKRSSVMYAAPATVSDAHVEADLGALGRVDAQFVASGAVESERSECGDKPTQFDGGAYVGTIAFRGEEGYTEASATSVPVKYRPILNLVCAGAVAGESTGQGLPGARLLIRSARHRWSVRINENRPGARMRYSAELHEQSGEVAISRSTKGVVPSRAFSFDTSRGSARLDPPAPFSGAATFTRDAVPRKRWTGSLAIDFPGRSNLSLTGPDVRTSLVPARYTVYKPHGS